MLGDLIANLDNPDVAAAVLATTKSAAVIVAAAARRSIRVATIGSIA
jgi:hypothetical protein